MKNKQVKYNQNLLFYIIKINKLTSWQKFTIKNYANSVDIKC